MGLKLEVQFRCIIIWLFVQLTYRPINQLTGTGIYNY